MKTFAVLLTAAILGTAAVAAGAALMQDEPVPVERPVRNQELPGKRPVEDVREADLADPLVSDERPSDDLFPNPRPRRQGVQTIEPRGDRGFGGLGTGGPGSGGLGMGMGGPGMGGPGMGMGADSGGPGMGMGMDGSGGYGPHGLYMRPRSVTRTIIEQRMEPLSKEEIAEMKKLAEATRLLNTSKDEVERKKAADTIREQLNAQFDRDLKRREKELADIETRVKALRDQVEKRKAARDRIVGLRLDTIVNEAEGLGFPSDNMRTGGPESDPFAPALNIPVRNRYDGGLAPDSPNRVAQPPELLQDEVLPADPADLPLLEPVEPVQPVTGDNEL